MIQRIQTVFLLGAAISMILMLFLPLAEILTDDGIFYSAMSSGLRLENGDNVFPAWPAFILILLTAILLFLNIFFYRNRKLQIRICVYSIILDFGLIGILYYFWVVILRQMDIDSYWLKVPLVFPLVAIIFTYLAFRGIRKDEIFIRSIDKIR